MVPQDAPAEVLSYWFGPLEDGMAAPRARRRWFAGDIAMDEDIRNRFGGLIRRAAAGELDPWLDSASASLAYVVVCDQFPRHVYRGTKDAFGTDHLALAAARRGVERGFDQLLGYDERAFFYMPFQHAESRVDQHTSVGLFTALRDDTPRPHRQKTGQYLRHAHQHRDLVLRFGRFPHRNTVLGRTSSAEEMAYLESASGRFGQEPRR